MVWKKSIILPSVSSMFVVHYCTNTGTGVGPKFRVVYY